MHAPARIALVLLLVAVACATTSRSTTRAVEPAEMTAAEHRQEAARERSRADDAYARWQPGARAPMPGGTTGSGDVPRLYPIDLYPYNPTDRAIADAERHLRHAREHEAAANALEGFEESECRDFAPKARAACPLFGPVAAIEDLPDGVRLVYAAGAPVDAVVAHMRCHLAFARARGFGDGADCPLYMRGIDIARGADGRGIEITSRERDVARELQLRARLSSGAAPSSSITSTPSPGR
jgi:hypothetical protein